VATNLENFKSTKAEPKLEPLPSISAKPSSATELLTRLRWANLGYLYHWGTKSYDFSKPSPPLPAGLRRLCKDFVAGIDWTDVWDGYNKDDMGGLSCTDWDDWNKTFEPDAGIVNFYQLQDTLMGHVDRSEVSSATPLVSISLGRPAIFLIGGRSRDIKPTPILLRSGDVVILSGGCRRSFHGVPRIVEFQNPPDFLMTTNSDSEWLPFGEYIENTRININVRQVFPPGYLKT